MLDPFVTSAWIQLMRAQRVVLASIEKDLRDADLPPLVWYDVLLEVARAPEGKLRPFDIEKRMLLAQYNLSRLLDRLEREGLVSRRLFDNDGRGRWIVITTSGRAMQKRMWTVYAKALDRHFGSKLEKGEADRLSSILSRLSRVG